MGKYPNRGKRQFTEREKRAYSAGKGYAAAKAGKRVECKTEKEKQSFRNGVMSVRGTKNGGKVRNTNKKSGKSKRNVRCENCGYIVDADGVLVKVRM